MAAGGVCNGVHILRDGHDGHHRGPHRGGNTGAAGVRQPRRPHPQHRVHVRLGPLNPLPLPLLSPYLSLQPPPSTPPFPTFVLRTSVILAQLLSFGHWSLGIHHGAFVAGHCSSLIYHSSFVIRRSSFVIAIWRRHYNSRRHCHHTSLRDSHPTAPWAPLPIGFRCLRPSPPQGHGPTCPLDSAVSPPPLRRGMREPLNNYNAVVGAVRAMIPSDLTLRPPP
eukprot:1182918-Prorocentrum_minimum.AAC.2